MSVGNYIDGDDWKMLTQFGITPSTQPNKAIAILARRVLELEHLHRLHHEAHPEWADPFTTPKMEERQSDRDRELDRFNRMYEKIVMEPERGDDGDDLVMGSAGPETR